MKKKPPRTSRSPAERLARLLRDAYLASYVTSNPFHAAPEWEEVMRLGKALPYLEVASRLLAAGVRPPEGD